LRKGLDKKPKVWYTKYNKEREVHTMKEAILTLSILAALIAFVALFCYITNKVIGWYYDRQDAKRRLAHPELYRLFDAVNEKASEGIHWRNEQIYPKKKQVDYILAELPYCIPEERAKKEQELEDLRIGIHTATVIDGVLENELVELRKQTKEYIEKHDLEWARKWGW
jgi:hypothetical protein